LALQQATTGTAGRDSGIASTKRDGSDLSGRMLPARPDLQRNLTPPL
jgi:hypothetical protein